MYFKYGETELEYLKSKDEKLKSYIEETGFIKRNIQTDIFDALIKSIISQQISSKAATTVSNRFEELGKSKPTDILKLDCEKIKSCGISYKKAEYILNTAEYFVKNKISKAKLNRLSDEEIIKLLTGIKGVGVWTVEMLLIFSLSRKNILSYNDLAIRRGIEALYELDSIDKTFFNSLKEKFSPYCTVASFYFWNLSNNANT